jgi:hypothetical protein
MDLWQADAVLRAAGETEMPKWGLASKRTGVGDQSTPAAGSTGTWEALRLRSEKETGTGNR